MEEKVYTIGRGKLIFKESGQTNYRDFGNCPDFKIATGIEKKDHFSSREGTKTKDKSVTIQQTATGSFTLDDLVDDDLKMFVMSNAVTNVVQASGSVTDQAVTAEHDKWQDLGKKKLSNVVVTNSGNTVTYVLNTDYRLDTEAGLFMPLSTGAITDGQPLLIDFNHAAITQKRVDSAKVSKIEGDIWFVGNPPVGKIIDVKGYVSITPKGDISLIGDDWANMQFEMEFLSGYGYNGLFDLYNRGTV